VKLAKDSIDLGIVVSDIDASLAFYRDLLGFEYVTRVDFPLGGGDMHFVAAGTTSLKLIAPTTAPLAAEKVALPAVTGPRYFTFTVSNIEEIAAALAETGAVVVAPLTKLSSGVTLLIVNDPDGNNVEFVQR
jgi:catechol 2,3-dioxygenase-like lactoylglutathione lyase family enzyme